MLPRQRKIFDDHAKMRRQRLHGVRPSHLVVKSLELEYHRPAKHADQLVIKTRTEPKGFTQLTCWQEAYRKSDGLMEKMVSAKLNLVAVNGEGRPRRLPELSQASTLPS